MDGSSVTLAAIPDFGGGGGGGVSLGDLRGPGLGPFGNMSLNAGAALGGVADIVSAIVGVITVSAFIWFIFQLLSGGFQWLVSGGDKTKLTEARDRMTNAFIGLLVVVAAWAIISLTGSVLGVNLLIRDPGQLIQNLKIQ